MSDLRKADVVNVADWMKERNQMARDLWAVHMPGFEMIEPGHRDWNYYFQIGDALLGAGYAKREHASVERFDEYGVRYEDRGAVPRFTWTTEPEEAARTFLKLSRVESGDSDIPMTLVKRPVRYETGAWVPVSLSEAHLHTEESVQKLLKGDDE